MDLISGATTKETEGSYTAELYAMRLTPLHGTREIPFGASHEDVIRAMGSPDSDEAIHDVESHPKGRRTLKYGDFSVTIGSEIGVFGMGVRASSEPLLLWDTKVNDQSPSEFVALLTIHGAQSETAPMTAYGATDVYSADHGILAYFADDRISQLEIQIPYCCPTKY